ncbi:outer membrane protein assembly factor BamE [Hydrogenophaga sp. IBVHS1]|jgi:outer membrane protein assembly factor BamE (lipoprotein component of BamABCDE complex)|uniref:outer membrane protein assembly factor BamE domain-containing protein n=1 Tax=unclassified Hydrogenophaga TaxID=2610897 RepID=UPI000A2E65F6|nr:outer membrane protein assembly factor BamE [Hydrogenophaga sp. IBVHS1]OSZ74422.1 outer membrane protein assembly factor BamE [Hydrogenophaga sp. IBVHS1]
MQAAWKRWSWPVLLMACAWLISGCDPQNISELEEGVSTEADVRERFGAPEAVWEAEDGGQIYEYNRQPAGHRNYMITIGPDGRMAALRQVLTPQNFKQVVPGMPMEAVRRMLGKPMKVTTYDLKRETHYDWRYLDGPNPGDSKIFTVVFDRDLRVVSTGSMRDPEIDPK